MSVSFPLAGRESVKLVKVDEDDDLWADDNDDDDVVKSADESGSCFLQYFSLSWIYVHIKKSFACKKFIFVTYYRMDLLVLSLTCEILARIYNFEL